MTVRMDTDTRREQLAHAALEFLATHRHGHLNMGRLAGRLGLVPSAIYRHFRGKDEILDAVLDLIDTRIQDNVDVVCREEKEPVRRLRLLLDRHVRLILENKGIPCLVFSTDIFCGQSDKRGRLYRTIQGFLDRVAGIIRDGQSARQIRSDVDPGVLAVQFLALVQPATMLWHLSDGRFDLTGHANRAWEFFAELIVPRRFREEEQGS